LTLFPQVIGDLRTQRLERPVTQSCLVLLVPRVDLDIRWLERAAGFIGDELFDGLSPLLGLSAKNTLAQNVLKGLVDDLVPLLLVSDVHLIEVVAHAGPKVGEGDLLIADAREDLGQRIFTRRCRGCRTGGRGRRRLLIGATGCRA